jgi:hypothetical protein
MRDVMGGILIGVVVLCAVVAGVAFRSGDAARRAAQGRAGPRPTASIGEAVRLAGQRRGRALVLFLGDDAAAVEWSRALAEDAAVIGALSAPDATHAVVRTGGDQRDVAGVLHEKWGKKPLPSDGRAALLLDAQGTALRVQPGAELGPLAAWLPGWLASGGDRAVKGA